MHYVVHEHTVRTPSKCDSAGTSGMKIRLLKASHSLLK